MLSYTQILQSAKKILQVANPSRIILFGSYARGDATEDSDLDLLVIVKNTEGRGRQMVTYRNAIGRVYPGIGVDVLVYGEDEAADPYPGTVLWWAIKEGKILYEAVTGS
ncbi:MAG: nucleotidyltransferase domain-containing protein [Methanospirillaceae archaeon]|nr:nucleotidyltransferase domain-containing protein [Methanospirillaceae archaeon]